MTALGIAHDIRVIPNFLDCAEYRRRFDPALRERVVSARPTTTRWSCTSLNFRPVKRVDSAIEVFRRIRQRVRARFVLIGDGPVRADIEQRVDDYDLSRHVTFVGERQDLVGWLSVADLFLLPSAQESFGLAALEAMACELPVVASNVGGLPEIIEDGVTGFVRPPEDGRLDGGSRRRALDRSRAARVDRAGRRGDAYAPLLHRSHRPAV